MYLVLFFRSFDFFRHQKEEGFRESLSSMKDLGDWLFHSLANLDHENKTEIRELFGNLLQISLWGNKWVWSSLKAKKTFFKRSITFKKKTLLV